MQEYLFISRIPLTHNFIVGEIIICHVQGDPMADGVIRADRVKALGRLGEDYYCRMQDVFEMKRPFVPVNLKR